MSQYLTFLWHLYLVPLILNVFLLQSPQSPLINSSSSFKIQKGLPPLGIHPSSSTPQTRIYTCTFFQWYTFSHTPISTHTHTRTFSILCCHRTYSMLPLFAINTVHYNYLHTCECVFPRLCLPWNTNIYLGNTQICLVLYNLRFFEIRSFKTWRLEILIVPNLCICLKLLFWLSDTTYIFRWRMNRTEICLYLSFILFFFIGV